jgi:hypothetical protein
MVGSASRKVWGTRARALQQWPRALCLTRKSSALHLSISLRYLVELPVLANANPIYTNRPTQSLDAMTSSDRSV